jgi:hypothetical protein
MERSLVKAMLHVTHVRGAWRQIIHKNVITIDEGPHKRHDLYRLLVPGSMIHDLLKSTCTS